MTEKTASTELSAHGFGLATITGSGAVLDVWFPAPALGVAANTLADAPEAEPALVALAES